MALITLTEFKAGREVSNTLPQKKFDPLLDDVEIIEIQPRLGLEFYADVVANPSDEKNAALLSGGSYTYNGKEYQNPGLKAVIIDFTYAYLKSIGDYADTPFGTRVKNTQFSERPERNERKDLKGHYMRIAESKWQLVELFLNRNNSDYSLWGFGQLGCKSGGRGVSFGFGKITS